MRRYYETTNLQRNRNIKILPPPSSQVWAVKILGLILDCEFRDAEHLAKIYVKGIETNEPN